MDDWRHEALRNDHQKLERKVRDLEDDIARLKRQLDDFESRVIQHWQHEPSS
jgi:predicted RNase H-like nuclease (RuvC/YqgF family)